MRYSFFLPGALLLALAGGAAAQLPAAADSPADAAEAISSVQVTAPTRALRIRDEQAEHITGSYALSDGGYLKVHTEPRHIVARIDHGDPIRMYAVAPYRFVSRDGKVAMDFRRGPAGEDMAMSYVPESGPARVEVRSVPLARR